MLDLNGVRVYITEVQVSSDYAMRTVELRMKAIIPGDSIVTTGPLGGNDLTRLEKLYHEQGNQGLWLTTPPKLIPPIKQLPIKTKSHRRRIILDDPESKK